MGLFDFLLGDDKRDTDHGEDWDRSVFDTDRFRKRGSGNWVDWEDVSTGNCDTDGFEHPNFDDEGEWQLRQGMTSFPTLMIFCWRLRASCR